MRRTMNENAHQDETTENEDLFPAPRVFRADARTHAIEARNSLLRTFALLASLALGVLILAATLTLSDAFFEALVDGESGPQAAAASPANGALSNAGANENISTPASQWRKGELPYLYQTDAAWAGHAYADGIVETHGCGPTCLSMVYIALTGEKDLDPAAMAAFSERNGYVDEGVTSWLFMSEGAQQLGLYSQELPADAEMVRAVLRAGQPIIASLGPGDFTNEGHFIVLSGLTDGGRVTVHDPNSSVRSAQSWELETILAQCRNLWSFDA